MAAEDNSCADFPEVEINEENQTVLLTYIGSDIVRLDDDSSQSSTIADIVPVKSVLPSDDISCSALAELLSTWLQTASFSTAEPSLLFAMIAHVTESTTNIIEKDITRLTDEFNK